MESAIARAKRNKADKFNQLVLGGLTQTEAWYQVNPRKRAVPYEQATSQASQYASHPYVRLRLQTYLRTAKVADLVSHGQLMAELRGDISLARAKDNLTAVMSGHRLAMQAAEMLKDSVTINQSTISDEEIIKRLAGDDPQLQARIRRQLGKAGFDAAPANDGADSDDANVIALHKSK